jgi:hypothetical protein
MDVDERIRTGLLHLQPDDVGGTPVSEVAARVQRRHRRRRAMIAAATTTVVLAAAAGTAAVLTTDRPTRVTSGPTTPSTVPATVDSSTDAPTSTTVVSPASQSGWVALPAAPLDARTSYAIAVADQRLLVWGGRQYIAGAADREFTDGAVLDLTSHTWSLVPAAPLEWSARPRAVAMGDDVMVISGTTAAVYSPTSNSWTALPPHGAPLVSGAVWTGTQLILAPAGPAYSLPDREWQPIAEPPTAVAAESPGEWQAAVWTGEAMVLIDQRAAAYDPDTDTWRELPAHPLANDYGFGAAWDGRRVIVVEQLGRGAAYDPSSDAWVELARVPVPTSICRAEVHAVAGLLVVRLCGADAVSADGASWSPFVATESPPGFSAANDGTTMYTMSSRLDPAPPGPDGSTGLAVRLAGEVLLDGELRPRQINTVPDSLDMLISELRAVVSIGSIDCQVRAGSGVFAVELDLGEYEQVTHLDPMEVTDDEGTWLAGGRLGATWAVRCPQQADAIAVLQRIHFSSEATQWRDADQELFDELKALEATANPSSVEQMFAAKLVEIEARNGGEPSLAYIDYERLLGVGGTGDDSVAYLEYLFELDGNGLLIRLEVRTVCARGLATPTTCI